MSPSAVMVVLYLTACWDSIAQPQPSKCQTNFQGVAWIGGQCNYLKRERRTSYRKVLTYNDSQLVLRCFLRLRQMAR